MTDRQEIKAARTSANEHMRGAVRDEWLLTRKRMQDSRGGKLTLPDETTDFASLKQRVYARALAVLDDIACHAPSNRDRIRAAEVIVSHELQAQRFRAELEGKAPPQPVAATVVQLTDEQAAKASELLFKRRQLQKASGE